MSNTTPPLKVPEGVTLIHGGNVERGDGKLLCLMEVVALLAGEPHGFHPACTSPALSTMGVEANDLLGNHERQGLLDLAPELVGTACWHCEEERVLASVMRACSVSLGGSASRRRTHAHRSVPGGREERLPVPHEGPVPGCPAVLRARPRE